MTLQELPDELAEAARSNRDKGAQFEKLIANYLLTDPQCADCLTARGLQGAITEAGFSAPDKPEPRESIGRSQLPGAPRRKKQ